MNINVDSSAAVICRQLCRTYYQGETLVHGLDHVDLCVAPGEFVCLSGPSGSGKTTLLNAIGGLDMPDSGEVILNGQRLQDLDKNQRAALRLNSIGFVFQSYNLIPVLSAIENVAFIMEMQGEAAHIIKQKSHAMLDEVGLHGMYDRLPHQLSGGQQQRVAVARAIVSNPSLILADEPTANLDSETARQLMELFVNINQKHKTTFIIATHDVRIRPLAQRRIEMQDGQIISDD